MTPRLSSPVRYRLLLIALLAGGGAMPAAAADVQLEFPLLTPEQLRGLPYQEALRNIELSRTAEPPERRRQHLQFAESQLRQFLAENPAHELAYAAQLQLGTVLVERGRLLVESARRAAPETPFEHADMLESRQLFDQAVELFGQGCRQLESDLASFPRFIPPEDTAQIRDRENVRRNLIEGRMYRAATLVELARSHASGSDAWRQQLHAAADAFERNYEEFRTMMAGLLARLKQAQCHQELGDTKRALGLYANLLDQPAEDPTIRTLRAGAMFKSLECWLSPHEGRAELAMVQGEEFLSTSEPHEKTKPEWLAVQYYTAVATRRYALALPEQQSDDAAALLERSRQLAAAVAQQPGSLQSPARQFLALPVPQAKPPTEAKHPPTSAASKPGL